MQFVEGQFIESYYPTIEDTFNKIIRYNGQDYSTEIVDTAGQVGLVIVRFDVCYIVAYPLYRMSIVYSTLSISSVSMGICLFILLPHFNHLRWCKSSMKRFCIIW
jgi:GTPase SAR1 family protein